MTTTYYLKGTVSSSATDVTSAMGGIPVGGPPGAMSPPFSDAYLLAYSDEHVAYEVKMFFDMEEALSKARADPAPLKPLGDPTYVTYALVESFVIHLRNLDYFLFDDTKKKGSDVLAIDFFATPKAWADVCPARGPNLANARDRASKEVAHLTTFRKYGSPPEKAWHFKSMASELRPVLRAFAANAMTTRLSSRVGALIR